MTAVPFPNARISALAERRYSKLALDTLPNCDYRIRGNGERLIFPRGDL
jgi:hypothetical protein